MNLVDAPLSSTTLLFLTSVVHHASSALVHCRARQDNWSRPTLRSGEVIWRPREEVALDTGGLICSKRGRLQACQTVHGGPIPVRKCAGGPSRARRRGSQRGCPAVREVALDHTITKTMGGCMHGGVCHRTFGYAQSV